MTMVVINELDLQCALIYYISYQDFGMNLRYIYKERVYKLKVKLLYMYMDSGTVAIETEFPLFNRCLKGQHATHRGLHHKSRRFNC